jgi:hypothetical protein
MLFCGSDPETWDVYQCSVPGRVLSAYITDTYGPRGCVQGETWGVYRTEQYDWGIWTRGGCQANFQVFFQYRP